MRVWSCGARACVPALAAGLASCAPAISHASPCPSDARTVRPQDDVNRIIASAPTNATFCLKPGHYRALAIEPKSGQRFYGEKGARLTGAQPLTSFRKSGRTWVAKVKFRPARRHGKCAPGFEACDLPEMAFLNDKALRQVLHKSNLKRGRFFVDAAKDEITLADDPTGKRIEFSGMPHAFFGTASDVLIEGLRIERYASPAQLGAVEARKAERWTLRNVEVTQNNAVGINLGAGGVVENSRIASNGQLGIAGAGREIRIIGNVISGNNTNGFKTDWEAGGVKITRAENVVMRANQVTDNNGPGLWCDIDCRNVVYENNTIVDNANAGIFHEISFAATIAGNTLKRNGHGYRVWFWDADILVAGSQDVRVTGNRTTTLDGGAAVALIDQNRTDRPSGKPYKTRNVIVQGNDFTFLGNGEAGGISDAKPNQENFNIIETGANNFDANVYRLRAGKKLSFAWGHETKDWSGFRAAGQEVTGRLIADD